jgi:hypothetical protein
MPRTRRNYNDFWTVKVGKEWVNIRAAGAGDFQWWLHDAPGTTAADDGTYRDGQWAVVGAFGLPSRAAAERDAHKRLLGVANPRRAPARRAPAHRANPFKSPEARRLAAEYRRLTGNQRAAPPEDQWRFGPEIKRLRARVEAAEEHYRTFGRDGMGRSNPVPFVAAAVRYGPMALEAARKYGPRALRAGKAGYEAWRANPAGRTRSGKFAPAWVVKGQGFAPAGFRYVRDYGGGGFVWRPDGKSLWAPGSGYVVRGHEGFAQNAWTASYFTTDGETAPHTIIGSGAQPWYAFDAAVHHHAKTHRTNPRGRRARR